MPVPLVVVKREPITVDILDTSCAHMHAAAIAPLQCTSANE